jgi:hypothetical protein
MDPTIRRQWELTGWKPWSIKIGNTYCSYNRLDPLGAMLGIAATYAWYPDAERLRQTLTDPIGSACLRRQGMDIPEPPLTFEGISGNYVSVALFRTFLKSKCLELVSSVPLKMRHLVG